MPVTVEQAYAEALAVQRTDVVTYYTLELLNPAWVAPVRVVEGWEAIVATLEADAPDGAGGVSPDAGQPVEFLPAAIRLTLPPVVPGYEPTLEIVVFDPAGLVVQRLNEATNDGVQEITTAVFRPYTSNDLSKPATLPSLEMEVRRVRASPRQGEVRATASLSSMLNLSCPWKTYNTREYPGLRR